MKYADQIMAARIFMGHSCMGQHECIACGVSERANDPIKNKLKTNFTNFNELMLGTGKYLCESCQSLMEDKDMRFKAVYYTESGVKQTPERNSILNIIAHPPEKFVLSLPYSFKKHHWLYAGLSNNQLALIGTDNRTVAINYVNNDVPLVINTIKMLIAAGVPRNEIILGKYTTFTRYKLSDIDKYDDIISSMRSCGAVELIVKYTPATTEKIKLGSEKIMITESETMAATILHGIASRSQFRVSDGIRFWGGYFERRINRLKNLELHEFISKLSDAVGSPQSYTDNLKNLNQEDEQKIMQEIREKTNLMVSLAYTIGKENKQ